MHAFKSRARVGALGVGAAAVALFADVEAARACLTAACGSPVRLAGMEFVPGNLVYFEITAENPAAMTLRTAAGEPIPASIRTIGNDRVFAPDAPIPPETDVVLEYVESCHSSSTQPPGRGEFAFRTFEHLPITFQPARLFVQEYGVAAPGQGPGQHAFVRVKLQPMADYAAEHLMRHQLSIDGHPSTAWPLFGSTWQVSVDSYCLERMPPGIFFDSCGGVSHVPLGRHTLVLTSQIIGHDVPLEPLTLEVETRCPTADADAPPADGDDEAPSEVREGASCAVPGGRAASSHAATVLLVLAALAVARGTRRSRQSLVD
jgi:hypothetical protein